MYQEDSDVGCSIGSSPGCTSNRVKILAYLGELRAGEFVPVKKLIDDLGLRFTTAKNILTRLEEEWIVEKRITTRHGTAASFRISPTAVTMKPRVIGMVNGERMFSQDQHPLEVDTTPFVPPEWSAFYGKHPYGT